MLYLPQNLEYSYGANWKGIQFGALGAMFEKGQSLGESFGQAAKIGGATLGSVLGDTAGKAFDSIIVNAMLVGLARRRRRLGASCLQ